MVNFGEQLLVSQYLPWALHYIDYQQLKDVLDEEYRKDKKANGTVSSHFLSVLYIQTEKVTFFVLQKQGHITSALDACRQELLKGVSGFSAAAGSTDEMVPLEERFVEAGLELIRLIRFVDLNVTGFRKILKKHDKMARTKLSLSYLALGGNADITGRMANSMSGGSNNQHSYFSRFIMTMEEPDLILLGNQLLQPLLHEDNFAALAAAFHAGTEEIRRWKPNQRNLTSPNLYSMIEEGENHGKSSLSSGKQSAQHHQSKSVSGGDLQSLSVDENAIIGSRINDIMSPGQVLLQIHAARGRLRNTNDFIKMLGYSSLVPEQALSERDDTGSKTRPSRLSNILNLLSTFLYMTNYYIVAPTSATYADKLGSDSSVASIIIGMTSVAALASTLLYSWWTSHSYKSALIFASTCSVIGNLFYAAGLPYQSITFVMVGRLMNGFGSARSINRRYIADSYSQADRTAASAAFVTATALGMATGPFLASLLHVATEKSTSVYWQAENAPGIFMFFVWIIYMLFLIWKFEDPPRAPSKKVPEATDHKDQFEGTLAEKTPLVSLGLTIPDAEDEKDTPLCCNVPVMVTLLVYMVLKMVLEAVLSSEENLTYLYFGWEGNVSGIHLTILALLILPVNFGIAFLARSYFDRELIIGLLIAMFLGCLIILQYQPDYEDYTLAQYLIGSAVLFVSASALEAPNMSLLSKVIPRKWSRGIINVGLLATESGTFGRVVGDFLLAAVGSHGLEQLLNRSFGWYAVIILGTLLATLASYDQLVELPDNDD